MKHNWQLVKMHFPYFIIHCVSVGGRLFVQLQCTLSYSIHFYAATKKKQTFETFITNGIFLFIMVFHVAPTVVLLVTLPSKLELNIFCEFQQLFFTILSKNLHIYERL